MLKDCWQMAATSPRSIPSLGDIGSLLGAQYAELRRVSKQFQPSAQANRLLLLNVDPNWEARPPGAFLVELLLQPNYLAVLPAWLSFQQPLPMNVEVIHTIIDLDDPKVVRLLTSYQQRTGIVSTVESVLRDYLVPLSDDHPKPFDLHRLHIAQGSELDFYYRGKRPPPTPYTYTFSKSVARQPELRNMIRLYRLGLVEAYSAITWYRHQLENSIATLPRVYHFQSILDRHHLPFIKAERHSGQITRLPQAVFKFLLDHVGRGDDSRALLSYAIGNTSPLYYSWYLDKFGVPEPAMLAEYLSLALLKSDFGVWARVYQPEIGAAEVLHLRLFVK